MIDLDSEQMQAAQDFDEFLWDGYLHNGGGVYTDISLKLQWDWVLFIVGIEVCKGGANFRCIWNHCVIDGQDSISRDNDSLKRCSNGDIGDGCGASIHES